MPSPTCTPSLKAARTALGGSGGVPEPESDIRLWISLQETYEAPKGRWENVYDGYGMGEWIPFCFFFGWGRWKKVEVGMR